MTIEQIIATRRITEVLHFTTNNGLAGILARGRVKPRKRLSEDEYLERIYKPNCADRNRDQAWHDYVNLSITTINTKLFGISSGNWHRDIDGWWCILSFHPEILTHTGVVFATTNNMYSGVVRSPGPDGLESLFAPQIKQWWSSTVARSSEIPDSQPTCYQAEVLYPGELAIDHLRHIYVRDSVHADEVAGICGALSLPGLQCITQPRAFGV